MTDEVSSVSSSFRRKMVDNKRIYDDNDGKADPFETKECKAQYRWQLDTYPTCNTLHELGIASRLLAGGRGVVVDDHLENDDDEKKNQILMRLDNNGYWRDVWTIQGFNPDYYNYNTSHHRDDQQDDDDNNNDLHYYYRYVLKTQRYIHRFVERNFDRSRRDALTAERLTSSPYISNIYSFCGTSLFTEYADGGDIARAIWPTAMKRQQHNSNNNHHGIITTDGPLLTKSEKLVIATQATIGLAALHNFDKEGIPSVAHTDITPGQFIKVGKRYKLSDFNRARFLRWDLNQNKPCGYTVQKNGGKNRSPEEYQYSVQSEKVDVYSLGNLFYMLLQGEWPFSDVEEREAKKLIKQGYRPSFDAEVWNSTHPVDQTIKEAMIMCHEQEPKDRATARQVESYLKSRLAELYPNITDF